MNDAFRRIKLDFRSSIPIYLQIVDRVERMITEGALKTGDQLPTVRELATELRVNFNTVARAYRMLDEAGFISTQQGRGTYIWAKPTEQESQQLRQKALDEITRQYITQANALGFSNEEITATFQEQLRNWKNNQPVSSGSTTHI